MHACKWRAVYLLAMCVGLLGYELPAQADDTDVAIELSNELMTSFVGYDVLKGDVSESPIALPSECHGTWLSTNVGHIKIGGHCTFKDLNGDTEYVVWEATPQGGTWQAIGGTGRWASKHNSGWTKEISRDGSMMLVQWGGTCDRWEVCRARTNAGLWALKVLRQLPTGLFDSTVAQAER